MTSTVYVVDDAAEYRGLIKQIFQQFLPQYSVRFFASGDELYDELTAETKPRQPGLILLDLQLPGRDGFAMLQFIRQPDQWPHVPVVVMTSMVQQTDIDACYEAGASAILQKSMSFEQLTDMLRITCTYWIELNRRPRIDTRQF
ncbi:response regulator [Spirosoma rhododendri]|uniref:Response regulator n=1 Tax=Spirosoma rhododendri TaxID=2728024 RepID=A0A7L5DQ48_9BACT|nr:response regulator [Spirosoma rhododendri]QJD78167.1 response regulator [Spirosoma rhododendri]